ncbi:hypothetical protein CHS0354_036927 [Potamilus streckersoni]|uniref:Translation machinery-associated protein 16 n=1 Tax=Potamilus streckersoni TaxID=2493646 RepID=A0AAE0SQJ0_9BIVA|nr:hypothetical protein CHS0354_036927 [Potamilus streckersoni]
MPKSLKAPINQSKKVIHPNSRVAEQLARKSAHEIRKHKSHSETTAKVELLVQKLRWFQENLDPQKTTFMKSELAELCNKYLHRFDQELEQIQIINSVGCRQKGNQHVQREVAIKLTLERETKEFEDSGMEVPDLINGKNLQAFKSWTGEAKYLPNLKLRKIFRRDWISGKDSEKSSS